jgi:DNA mismatch endonuclease, patch repair protein
MSDTVSVDVRSQVMSKIKSRDTKPELLVRSFLHRRGFRFRLHVKGIPGQPDVVLRKYRTAIFVHGCFWHQHSGCVHSGIPLSNREYWEPKLRSTVSRDKRHSEALRNAGWNVEVIWECEISSNRLHMLAQRIEDNGRG